MLSYADQDRQDKKIWLDYIQQSVDSDLATIDEVYFAPDGHFWIATVEDHDGNDVVVGMVGLERKPDNQGEIRRMSVKTEYRRYGIGRQLVSQLEQWAKNEGLTKLWLSTGGPMAQAQTFYKSIGYVHTTTKVFAAVEIMFFEKQISGDP